MIVVAMQNDFLAKGVYYERRERYEKQIREGRLEVDEMVDRLGRPGHPRPGGFEPRSKSLETVGQFPNAKRVNFRTECTIRQ